MPKSEDVVVPTLGPCRFPSPVRLSTTGRQDLASFVSNDARVALDMEWNVGEEPPAPTWLEKSGPRANLFFDPARTRAGIVTCGGLCPGINNVVRSLVLGLHHTYGVPNILGFRYGYQGLDPSQGMEPLKLTLEDVSHIHRQGGSFLGTARGAQDPKVMVDTLLAREVDILFAIGGDGTLRGAHRLAEEIARRGAKISIVGIPKTIDNDVPYVDKTFGFETAVEASRLVLNSAHTECSQVRDGIGLVKLMGRDSGFIAASATLASGEVNFCLVPEVPFTLDGPHGLLAVLEQRLAARSHALIAVAEGCGLSLATGEVERDASGNVRYSSAEVDVGPKLRTAISEYFKARGKQITFKYIDPSYIIRSVPANTGDAIYCDRLARHALHAAMAGKTDVMIGRSHGVFTHVPLTLATSERKRIVPNGGLWFAVTETTGQPPLLPPAA